MGASNSLLEKPPVMHLLKNLPTFSESKGSLPY
jgi:hypothetical protein